MTTFWVGLVFVITIIDIVLPSPTIVTNVSETVQSNLKSSNNSIQVVNANDSSANQSEIPDEYWEYENTTVIDSRRILYSKRTLPGKRPYMVYLQLTKQSAKAHKYRGWLCGGVILHKYYVLTSAACVEDADHFYIVSGTTRYVDTADYKSNDCVCKHRRRVVWKCVPKNYKFDFQDSMKWSSNDIAIVKVEKPFKFGSIESGCEFAATEIIFNNVSRELEKTGTKGFIAGWGSGSNFREGVYRRYEDHVPNNAKCLQEAKVCIMDNEQCAKKWAQKFRSIIQQYMICTKDVMRRISEKCHKYANCTDVEMANSRRGNEQLELPTRTFNVDLGRHLRDPDDYTARRSSMYGGFCENDHGGPLLVKYEGKERVIGIISACKIDPKSHNCHGPFLYTSVFKNRQFIQCSIFKDTDDYEDTCRRVFRGGITHEEWDIDWDSVREGDNDDDDDRDDDSDRDSSESMRVRKNKVKSSKHETNDSKSNSASAEKRKDDDKNEDNKENKESESKKSKKRSTKSKKSGKSKKKSNEERKGSERASYESSKDENINEPDE